MKIPLSEWNDLLKEFLSQNTIKAYYRRYRGDEKALAEIAHKQITQSFRSDLFALDYWDNKKQNAHRSIYKAIARGLAVGKGEVDSDIEQKADDAEDYIAKHASIYIREGDGKDFVKLVAIIRKYKIDIEKNILLRAILKGKTLYEKNEKAKAILSDAQRLLYLMGSDIKLPAFQEPNDNRELTAVTKSDIMKLDISFDSTNTVDKLLEDIRKL